MDKNYLQKTLILSGLVLWIVVILLEGEISKPNSLLLQSLLQTSNTNIIKGICFLIGGINILLGTVLIEYSMKIMPIIITFLFVDYGLILSCIKAIYEVVTLNNSLDYINPTSTISALLFTLTYKLTFANQISYITMVLNKKYGINIANNITEKILSNVNIDYIKRTPQDLLKIAKNLYEKINAEKKEMLEKAEQERFLKLNKNKPIKKKLLANENKLIMDFSPYKMLDLLEALTKDKIILGKFFESLLFIYIRHSVNNLNKKIGHYKLINELGTPIINSAISLLLEDVEQKYNPKNHSRKYFDKKSDILTMRNVLLANQHISFVLFVEPTLWVSIFFEKFSANYYSNRH